MSLAAFPAPPTGTNVIVDVTRDGQAVEVQDTNRQGGAHISK